MRHLFPPHDPRHLQHHRQVQRQGNERIAIRLQGFRYLAHLHPFSLPGASQQQQCAWPKQILLIFILYQCRN